MGAAGGGWWAIVWNQPKLPEQFLNYPSFLFLRGALLSVTQGTDRRPPWELRGPRASQPFACPFLLKRRRERSLTPTRRETSLPDRAGHDHVYAPGGLFHLIPRMNRGLRQKTTGGAASGSQLQGPCAMHMPQTIKLRWHLVHRLYCKRKSYRITEGTFTK